MPHHSSVSRVVGAGKILAVDRDPTNLKAYVLSQLMASLPSGRA
jgi:hypothetical protein